MYTMRVHVGINEIALKRFFFSVYTMVSLSVLLRPKLTNAISKRITYEHILLETTSVCCLKSALPNYLKAKYNIEFSHHFSPPIIVFSRV